ncbi:expressed protein [Phakopsora pachyrhizi]|uniref:Expressed protein n=1 Tax=Phakopsora pachyrhizi TaxID=170000 RepID=A0AAV0APE1_PHAPC|nr:expressed protein [Phakopsora pachyrhizi]
MTIGTKNLVFSWVNLLLIIFLLRSSDATEGTEAFQWSRILEESSKLDDKAPLTSIWSLFGDDSIKHHELELSNQIREDPPMVKNNNQNPPRVHPADPQSSSLYQPSMEEMFSSGSNGVGENFRFGGKKFPFTWPGDNSHFNLNKTFNHINGGAQPGQILPSLPVISADFCRYPELSCNEFFSSFQGNHDHQLYHINHLIQHRNENNYSLDPNNYYKDYNGYIKQYLSSDLDWNQEHYMNQDFNTYNNQLINYVENQYLNYGSQSIFGQASNFLNPSQKNDQYTNIEEFKGLDLIENVDLDQYSKKFYMKKKRPQMENELTKTFSNKFQQMKKTKKNHMSESKNSLVGSKSDDDTINLGNGLRKDNEVSSKETLPNLEVINKKFVLLEQENQEQESTKLNIPKRFFPFFNELKIHLVNHFQSTEVKNENEFINKALLYMKSEMKMEVVNYALEYFLSISTLPYMANKRSFLEEVSKKRTSIFQKKRNNGFRFLGVGALYLRSMKPENLVIKKKDKWSFNSVLLEIQAKLGIDLLINSELGYLPEKETKNLKAAYEKQNEISKVKLNENKLDKIVEEVVLSLMVNIYQISILKQTATYFDAEIGIEEDFEKNWNSLASAWYNFESLEPESPGSIFEDRKKNDKANISDLNRFLKRKKCIYSISGGRARSYQISMINFEIWFKNNYRKLEWFTQLGKINVSNLQSYMIDFSLADWWENYQYLSYNKIDCISSM